MFWFILGIVLFLLGVFGPKKFDDTNLVGAKVVAVTVGLLLVIVGVFFSSYQQVPAGYRGVLLQFGAVKGVLNEGANFVVPFMQTVNLENVQTQKSTAKGLTASSQDLQTVTTDVSLNYHVDPTKVGVLYRSVGDSYEDTVIDPKVQEILKAVVAKYTAEQLIRERDQVKNDIESTLTTELAAYNILVDNNGVSLTNFDFSQDFDNAIEAKQVAQQTAEQQKYVLAQAQLQAETAITTAKGIAQSNEIKAQALNSQGGQKVLTQAWIDKWDGTVPTVVSGGSGYMINLDSLKSKTSD